MKTLNLVMALSVSALLSACAIAGDVTKHDPKKPTVQQEEYLPFYIAIKADGTPVIKGRDGEMYTGEEISLPLKSTLIESFQTISYIKYHGSCKIVIDMNGKKLEFVLPDSYCAQYQ